MNRKTALILMSNAAAVPLGGEWIEEFWCQDCQSKQWYHVRKQDRNYSLLIAPVELWQQAVGVTYPETNPSVSEFTLKQARANRGKLHNRF